MTAAEDLFARKGLEGTSVKEIGGAVSQNPALIYYYFHDKAGLYRTVLQRVVTEMVARGGAAFDAAASPADAIRALVMTQMEFMLSHPNAPRLLVREMLDHEAREAETVLVESAAALFQRLCGVIAQGQEDGSFRKDVEPRFAAISTIAQVIHFITARPAIGLFLGTGGRGVPEVIAKQFARHAGDFAVQALSQPEPT